MKRVCALCLVLWCIGDIGTMLAAELPSITGIVPNTNGVLLTWDPSTNRFIIEKFSDLTQPSVCCGSSSGLYSSAIHLITSADTQLFYRMQFGLEVVPFPDPILEAAVRSQLATKHLPTNMLYDIDLISLDQLWIFQSGVADLTGLEHCTNLKLLLCNNASNQVTNLAPLSGLTNLFEFWMRQAQVTDVGPLAGVTTLGTLDLSYSQIEDISPLAGLTNMLDLLLDGNRVRDISALSGMRKMDELHLGWNQIGSIDALAGMTNLVSVNLAYNAITNIEPLAGLTNLQVLNLESNQVSDISALSGLTKLFAVLLKSNLITDLSGLITNTSLGGLGSGDYVYLQGNPLSSFAHTNQIPFLTNHQVTVYYDP